MEKIKDRGVQRQGNNQESISSGSGRSFQQSLQHTLQSLLTIADNRNDNEEKHNNNQDPVHSGSAATLRMSLFERRRHKAGPVDAEFKHPVLTLEDHTVNEDDIMVGKFPLTPPDDPPEGIVIPDDQKRPGLHDGRQEKRVGNLHVLSGRANARPR